MKQRPKAPVVLFLLLLLPALLWNLGRECIIEDEAIRGLVAQEMMLRGNYIAPTLNGEYYYKKPPVYNWFIAASFALHGEANEWSLRLPTIFFLLLFAWMVFRVGKTYLNQRVGILAAMAFLTNGRILFYDSMKGLIDTAFSMVIFLLFVSIYRFSSNRKWKLLFLSAYACMSLAFLLKGLPALVFLGLTLVAWLVYIGEWRRLFRPEHFLGISLSILILGDYLIVYNIQHDALQLLRVFLLESSKATPVEQGFWATFRHLFVFPFDLIYHFLPWTILFVFLIRKDLLRKFGKHTFLIFCALTFLANIWVYWLSPRVFPRYLFMFLPLLFYIFFYFYDKGAPGLKNEIEWILGGLLTLVAIALPFALSSDRVMSIAYAPTLLIGASLALIGLIYFFYREKGDRLLWFACGLLILRIVFNGLVIPARLSTEYASAVLKPQTLQTAQKYRDQSLTIVGKENTYDQYSYYTNSFYLTAVTGHMVSRKEFKNLEKDELYILDTALYKPDEFKILDSLPIRHQRRHLYIAELD
jgi:4-amino-4-deoxy-L-arabinose transferase-like glycosyltransferase